MRTLALLPLVLAIGCQTETELRYNATLDEATNGVAMSEDGTAGFAAMQGLTCTIDTEWGCPTADADLPAETQAVVDHYHGDTLSQTDLGLHRTTGSVWDSADDLLIDGIKTAKLTDYGRVVLHADASACMLNEEGAMTPVPEAACADGVDTSIDRASGALYAATTDGLLRLSAVDGVTHLDVAADLLSRDVTRAHSYLSLKGTNVISALADDGVESWSATLDVGGITDLAARGVQGDLLVFATEGDHGVILRLDGQSGEVESRTEVPSREARLEVSDNGQTVAVITPDAVHWYSVEVEGEEPALNVNPQGDCLTGFGSGIQTPVSD